MTFKKMCAAVLLGHCCHEEGKIRAKKRPVIERIRRHSRKRLLIKLIILVMVLQNQSHDFLTLENSRLLLKFEHSLLG